MRVNGSTALSINKIDTLSGIHPLKVCTAYKKADGTILKHYPASLEELAQCEPVYEEFEGFDGDLSQCKSFEELPEKCREYLAELERLCECPIKRSASALPGSRTWNGNFFTTIIKKWDGNRRPVFCFTIT